MGLLSFIIFDIVILGIWFLLFKKSKNKDGNFWKWIKSLLKFYFILSVIILLAVSAILIEQSFKLYKTDEEKTLIEMEEISKAILKFNIDLQTTEISLSKIIGNNPIKKDWESDKWGTPYELLKTDSNRFILTSAGLDKKWNTADDLNKDIQLSK